jgi:hypothetical protein
MKPNRNHDGKVITIRYTGGMEPPFNLTGRYIHRPRSTVFDFAMDNGRSAVFERSDFVVVKG